MLCKSSKEGNARAPGPNPVLNMPYGFPSSAGRYGVTPEIYVSVRRPGSQQICISILQSIMPMYLSAFGELRFDLVTEPRMSGTARLFTQFVK